MSRPLSTFGTSGMSRPSSAEQRSQDTSRLSERSTSPLTSALHREWSYVPTSTTGPNGPGTYDPKPLKHKERAARILAPHTREVPTIMASGGLIYILNSEADQADAASRQASSSVAMLTANQQLTSRSASTNNTVMRSASVASGLPGGRMSQLSRETAPTGFLSGGMIHYRTSSVGDAPPVGTYTLPPKVDQRSYTFGKARNPTFERLQSKDTDINSCPQGTWFATRQGNIIYGRPTTLDTPGIGAYVMNSTSPQRVLNASRATNSMKPERTSTLYQRPRVLAYSQKTDAQHLELGQYFSDAAYSSFKTRTHNAKLSQKKEIPRVRRRLQVTKNT